MRRRKGSTATRAGCGKRGSCDGEDGELYKGEHGEAGEAGVAGENPSERLWQMYRDWSDERVKLNVGLLADYRNSLRWSLIQDWVFIINWKRSHSGYRCDIGHNHHAQLCSTPHSPRQDVSHHRD